MGTKVNILSAYDIAHRVRRNDGYTLTLERRIYINDGYTIKYFKFIIDR